MTENSTYQKRFKSLMKEIDQARMLNCIDSNIRNAIYSLQTMMRAYGTAGVRIIVTVDNIIAERIEEDE